MGERVDEWGREWMSGRYVGGEVGKSHVHASTSEIRFQYLTSNLNIIKYCRWVCVCVGR